MVAERGIREVALLADDPDIKVRFRASEQSGFQGREIAKDLQRRV